MEPEIFLPRENDHLYSVDHDPASDRFIIESNWEAINFRLLETKLKGSINNPQILVGGKNFIQKENKEPLEDIKKIIEEGITNIFQKLLDAQ